MERSNSFIFAGRPKIDKETMLRKVGMKCFKNADKCYGIACDKCILNVYRYGKRRKAI